MIDQEKPLPDPARAAAREREVVTPWFEQGPAWGALHETHQAWCEAGPAWRLELLKEAHP